jgi:hypothetical protein
MRFACKIPELLKLEPHLVPSSTEVCETAFVTLFSPRAGPPYLLQQTMMRADEEQLGVILGHFSRAYTSKSKTLWIKKWKLRRWSMLQRQQEHNSIYKRRLELEFKI